MLGSTRVTRRSVSDTSRRQSGQAFEGVARGTHDRETEEISNSTQFVAKIGWKMIIYMFSGIKRYCNLKLFRKQQEQEIEIFSGIKTENQNVHECLKYVMT